MSVALSRLEHRVLGVINRVWRAFDGLVEGFAVFAAYKD
jgi:hypothetical protein